MQRVHHTTAKATLVLTPVSGAPGFFGAGSPLIAPTVVTSNWVNGVQEELIYVIQQGGLTPNINVNTQVWDALRSANDGRYVKKAGDTMTGILVLSGNPITDFDAATKQYVDNTSVSITGDTMTNFLTLNADPVFPLHAATKAYVDAISASLATAINRQSYVATAGQTAFSFTHVPGFADVFLNGVKLVNGVDFVGSGGVITLTLGAAAGDTLDLISIVPSSAIPLARKNAVINGNFNLSQRGTTQTGITGSVYGADRWFASMTTHGTWTYNQIADAPAGTDFTNCANLLVTTADPVTGASDIAGFVQRIEGFNFRPLYQKPFTLSFWVKSNVVGPYYFAFDNFLDRSYVVPYTINATNTWEYKTITVTEVPVGGVWNFSNGIGLQLQWNLGGGTNFQTATFNTWLTDPGGLLNLGSNQVNVAATVGNYWRITGVQLEIGTNATEFEHRPFGEELELCQRYYEKTYDINIPPGTPLANGLQHKHSISGLLSFYVHYGVTKRSLPTNTIYSYRNGTPGTFTHEPTGPPGSDVGIVIASNGQSGFHTVNVAVANASNYLQWTADAEL